MGRLETAYAWLPAWAQHLAVTGYGAYRHRLRFGGSHRGNVSIFAAREHWPAGELRDWVDRRLVDLVRHARQNSPFYSKSLAGVDPTKVTLESLADIPLTEKEPVRSSPHDLLTVPKPTWRHHVFHTSGSTGTPIATIWTAEEYRTAFALREARSARWAGVSFSLPRATFSGRLVVPEGRSASSPYRYNATERQIYFSAFHLSPESAPRYVEAMHRHRPRWLTGYAVSFYLLARMILEQNLEVPRLRAVVTTSEKTTEEMRLVMERAYGCPVYEEYSSVENAVFASECEERRLHVSTDATVVEILRPDGSRCDPGEIGEVVGTNLFRYLQPMLRFRLGDSARWSDESCPCGRSFPVIEEVVGRTEDVVVGADGRQMVRFHGVFVDLAGVREGQIVQESVDSIRVKIVPTEGYELADAEEIVRRVQERLGSNTSVRVEEVDSIPRNRAGKYQAVISHLDTSS